jgi:hypothetical protein
VGYLDLMNWSKSALSGGCGADFHREVQLQRYNGQCGYVAVAVLPMQDPPIGSLDQGKRVNGCSKLVGSGTNEYQMHKVSENEIMNEQCHGRILHGRLIHSLIQLELFQPVGVVSVVSGSDRWSLPSSRVEEGIF